MLPVRVRTARVLYGTGVELYRLGKDDTEGKVENGEFEDTESLYGVEKPAWQAFISSERGRAYLTAWHSVAESAGKVINEEMSYVDGAYADPLSDKFFEEREAIEAYLDGNYAPSEEAKPFIKPLIENYHKRFPLDILLEYYGWDNDSVYSALAENIADTKLNDYAVDTVNDINFDEFMDEKLNEINWLDRLGGDDEDRFEDIVCDLKPEFEDSYFNKSDENYAIAKAEADKVDEIIIDTIKQGLSFRVEAGAGSGKTYSLNRVIEWIQANKWSEFQKKKQNVVCITYTNAAVDVIAERLDKDSFILPSTIHSFAWNAIKQYQSALKKIISSNELLQPKECDMTEIMEIQYTLGHRYQENGILYLYHDDVISLFNTLLDNAKFRKIFSDKYPLILIDEYQDSFQSIVERFIEYFISKGVGPQFGFFGDAWQTIYQSNKACGLIEHENIKEIKKGSNFRSAPKIVEMLNFIRPDLPQRSAIDGFDGEITVITCDDYKGQRRTDRNFKDELQIEEFQIRLSKLKDQIENNIIGSGENLKILMITHKVLASQQGYDKLLDVISDGLKDKEDVFLLFFMNTVEPIYKALSENNMQLLFDTLKVKRYPINRKSEKQCWKELRERLSVARSQKSIDVLKTVLDSKLIPVPQQIEGYYDLYYSAPETIYCSTNIKEFLDLQYAQFLSAINFLYPESEFSTEHGVKGEEYDNVVFVISRGWNQYQFEKYIPMIKNGYPTDKEASYIRNRNLFYVCCSRPKKRLFIFISIPVDDVFRNYLENMVGKENIVTYKDFIEKGNRNI